MNRTRTVALIRHAKSSWNDPGLSDFERPLNKRGNHDAPRVGTALADEGIAFDRVLCSDAKRARQTLSLLQQELDIDPATIEHRHDLYGASAEHLLASITELDDSLFNIALVGHNPGMEDLADMLAADEVGAMPTCSVIHLVFNVDGWNDLQQSKGNVSLMIRPRDL